MTSAASPPRRGPLVRCPTCGGESRFDASNAWRPFCSERCKGVDLGAWASERYRVAEQAQPDDAAGTGEPQDTGPH
jgi:endogenous inhibitor of DNA gyrase (YacG/DUF329 family)